MQHLKTEEEQLDDVTSLRLAFHSEGLELESVKLTYNWFTPIHGEDEEDVADTPSSVMSNSLLE